MDCVWRPVVFFRVACLIILYVVYSFVCSAIFCVVSDLFTFCAFLYFGRTFVLSGPIGCSASVAVYFSEFCRFLRQIFYVLCFSFIEVSDFFSSSFSGESFNFSYMYSCNASVIASIDMSLFLIFFLGS